MERRPAHRWIHISALLITASFCTYWHWQTPLPNKAVLFLGGIAIVLTFYDPNKIYKVLYLALVVWLMFTENHAINEDHSETVAKDEARREEQNTKFQGIADELTQSIFDNRAQFDVTMKKSDALADASKRNLDLTRYSLNQITGSDQFCYLEPILQVSQNQWQMAFINSGKFPLLFCHVIIHRHYDADEGLRLAQTPEGRATLMSATEKMFGPLPPGKHGFASDLVLETDKNYDIEIYTWNGQFAEKLFINSDFGKKHVPLSFLQVNGGPRWGVVYHSP